MDHHAPLYRRDYEIGKEAVIISEAVDYWLAQGMPAQKLIFGVPSYGRTFRLANSSQTGLLSPAIGAGPQGPYTGQDGFLSLYEICNYQKSGWNVVTGKYIHKINYGLLSISQVLNLSGWNVVTGIV